MWLLPTWCSIEWCISRRLLVKQRNKLIHLSRGGNPGPFPGLFLLENSFPLSRFFVQKWAPGNSFLPEKFTEIHFYSKIRIHFFLKKLTKIYFHVKIEGEIISTLGGQTKNDPPKTHEFAHARGKIS